MKMSVFLSEIEQSEEMFKRVRDYQDLEHVREKMDEWWSLYSRFADPNFKSALASDFQSRFWELYLAGTLIDFGYLLKLKEGTAGPDLLLDFNDNPLWIEAVAPGPGTGTDAVLRLRGGGRIPEDKIVLRFTSAIRDKHIQLTNYLRDELVGKTDTVVIAVNGFSIPHAVSDDEIPYAIQAVLPLGLPQGIVDTETMELIETRYEHRPVLKKASGAEVQTSTFLDERYAIISGILYSNCSAFNFTPSGRDFVFLHNPNAVNPLPRGWLEVGVEYWVEENSLRRKQWV